MSGLNYAFRAGPASDSAQAVPVVIAPHLLTRMANVRTCQKSVPVMNNHMLNNQMIVRCCSSA